MNKSTYYARIAILISQAIFCAIMFIYQGTPASSLLIVGIWNTFAWGTLLVYEIVQQKSILMSPIIFYILKAVLTSGICNIYLSYTKYTTSNKLYWGVIIDDNVFCNGALLLMFEEIMVIAFYYFLWSKINKRIRINNTNILSDLKSYKNFIKTILITFLLISVFRICFSEIRIGIFLESIASYGLTCVIICILLYEKQTVFKMGYPIKILLGIQFLVSLSGNSKEDIILTLVPIFLLTLSENHKTKIISRFMLLSIVVFFLTICIVYPGIAYRRTTRIKENREISLNEMINYIVLANTFGTPENEDIWNLEGSGYSYMLERNAMTIWTAFAVQEVSDNRKIGYRFVRKGLIALIPRFLWPNKPLISMGAEMDSYIRTGYFYNTSGSCTCLGMSGSSLLQGGILLVVISCFFAGGTVAICFYYTQKIWYNPFGIVIYFLICKQCFRHFESIFDAGIVFVIPLIMLYVVLQVDTHLIRKIIQCQQQID